MVLRKISLHNFRNFDDRSFEFNPFLTIIIAQNASGKTNLLEGIYFLINGVGFRETKEIEFINFNEKKTSMVEGVFMQGDSKVDYKVALKIQNGNAQKNYFVSKVKKRQDRKKKLQSRISKERIDERQV